MATGGNIALLIQKYTVNAFCHKEAVSNKTEVYIPSELIRAHTEKNR
jgi:hypothetical protein